MKSIKLFGLMLLALFALGAFAAVSASAEEGFLPLKQKTALALGGLSELETASNEPIHCEELDDSTVTFTNDKHAEGTLHWLGCTGPFGFPVNSLGHNEGEILVPLLFLVCLDPKGGGVLIDNFGVAGEIDKPVHLEVPTIGVLIIVTGTALGAILTVGPAELWSMEFKGSKGTQAVTECLEGKNTKKHTLKSETNENKKPEAASENVESGLLQFKEVVKLEDS